MTGPMVTPYDSLIVAAGVQSSYFGHDEFAAFAPGLKSIDDALELRGRIFGAFEAAETEADPHIRQQWLTFVVVGGGPTGVEMAGQIAELSQRALRANFRVIDPASSRVVLFEGGPALLSGFGRRPSRQAHRVLEGLGVEVRLSSMVTGMDEEWVEVRTADGVVERVEARTKVWAAGMTASPLGTLLAEVTDAELDRMGRVRVLPDCSVPGHPEIFVVGDLMTLDDLAGMAEAAMQTGRHAARLIARRATGEDGATEPFHYLDLGMLAVISRFKAVARFGRISVGGTVGWALWLTVHLTFLTGFKNRVSALAHWTISFIGRGRSERTVTEHQVRARRALEILASAEGGPSPVPARTGDGPGRPTPTARRPSGLGVGVGSA